MKYSSLITANYSADLFGICSALYELGGLIVMHDASGCNSTYATHDEPRWYDIDSMIYISGLTEYDAVVGNEERYIRDVLEVAEERHPEFIAVFGAPVAAMIGTDFRGIARIIEKRSGIPTFGFHTTGMRSYIDGAKEALAKVAERFCPDRPYGGEADFHGEDGPCEEGQSRIRVNLLGMTPLDFSVVGNQEALTEFCRENGFEVVTCWCMGNSLEDLKKSGEADVNLVLSTMAIDLAAVLRRKYGIPSVTGLPVGAGGSREIASALRMSAADRRDRRVFGADLSASSAAVEAASLGYPDLSGKRVLLIGEPVQALSIRHALERDAGADRADVLCALDLKDSYGLLRDSDLETYTEEEIRREINASDLVIADPIYAKLIKSDSDVRFIRFPHEAYSGRTYRPEIPVFLGPDFDIWMQRALLETGF